MSVATNIPAREGLSAHLVAHAEAVEFRRRVSSISRQSSVYFAGTLFSAIAGYFFKIYLARALGASALGLYALGISIVSAVGLFNAAGLPVAGARFVAEYSAKRDYARLGSFLRGGISLLGIGSLLLAILVLAIVPWVAVRFYHAPALSAYSVFFAAIMLLGVLNCFLGQCMAGYQAVARRSISTQFVGVSVTILFSYAFIHLNMGLAGYLGAQVLSAMIVLILLAVSTWQLTPSEARSSSGFQGFDKRVVAFSATSFAIAAVHLVLAQADKVTLGYYLAPRQVGIYTVSMAMAAFVPIALTSVNQIFSSTIVELHVDGNHAMLQKLYSSLTKWILIVTLPLALTVIIFAKSLMTVFGPGFETGAIVLLIGVLAQLFNCGVGSAGFLLLMSGNQRALMKIEAVNAAGMIVLNLLLVPRFGILGAAIAASISVAGTNLWALLTVRTQLKLFPYNHKYLKLIAPTLVCLAILVVQHGIFGHPSWRIAGLALPLAYLSFGLTMLMLGLDSEDRMLARIVWEMFDAIQWRWRKAAES